MAFRRPIPRNPDASEDLNQIVSLYEIPGAPFMEYRMDVPHGAIASVWYPSSVTGGLRRMHVYTPPGYTGKEKLPVLYLFTERRSPTTTGRHRAERGPSSIT